MKASFHVYIIASCPIIAAHISCCVEETGGTAYITIYHCTAEGVMPIHLLNENQAIGSDMAIIVLNYRELKPFMHLADRLHYLFDLSILWISTHPIHDLPPHDMLAPNFSVLQKPFSEFQVKFCIKKVLKQQAI
jgi:hypothetical protein